MENPDWVKAVFDLEDLELRFGFAVDALQLMADGLGAVYEEQACNAVDTMARLFDGMHREMAALVPRMLAVKGAGRN